jgi:hypothetical protein
MKKFDKIKGFLLIFLVFMICLPCYSFAQSEQITLESYFPTRFGNYDEVHASKLAVGKGAKFEGTDPSPDKSDAVLNWGNKRSSLKAANHLLDGYGSSIELGGTGTMPYIDFSDDLTAGNDYDVRIYLDNTYRLIFSKSASSTRILGLETCVIVIVGGGEDPSTICSGAGIPADAVIAGFNYGAGIQYGNVLCCSAS